MVIRRLATDHRAYCVLAAVFAVLWVLSLRVECGAFSTWINTSVTVRRGYVGLKHWSEPYERFVERSAPRINVQFQEDWRRPRLLPVARRDQTWLPGAQTFLLFVPFWIPSAFCAVGAVSAYRRRPRPGKCWSCRYSLRGIPPNSPCPECGAAPVANV